MKRHSKNSEASMNDYLFDLQGFFILRKAVEDTIIEHMNRQIDKWMDNPKEAKSQGMKIRDYSPSRPIFILENIICGGKPFDQLINHPSWIEYIQRYCCAKSGGPYLCTNGAFTKGKGCSTKLHSGGHENSLKVKYEYSNGNFHCGQINVMLSLIDQKPGDGSFMIIPGSHKSNIAHPAYSTSAAEFGGSLENVEMAKKIFLNAGDVLIFSGSTAHGSALRKNIGYRRYIVNRYGPIWEGSSVDPNYYRSLTQAQKSLIYPLN